MTAVSDRLPAVGPTFAAVGDISLGDQPVCLGFGVRSRSRREGYGALFDDVRSTLRNYDTVVGNLESVIADREEFLAWGRGIDVDRADPPAAEALREAGVSLVSLANNHIFEYGPIGLQATVSHLGRSAIEWTGKLNQAIRTIGTKKVAFLSWSLLPDVYWKDLDPAAFYNVTADFEPIKRDIQSARSRADYVVVLLHWGNEFCTAPSSRQRTMAHALIDCGANVLIGHHPHVLQPIEMYRGGLIAYSLGNFVMDYWKGDTQISAILEVTLGETVKYRAIPVRICGRTYRPTIARDGDSVNTVKRKLEELVVLDESAYAEAVYKARTRARLASLVHLVANVHRVGRSNLAWLLSWGLKRLAFLVQIAREEKRDPNIVYRGPMR